MPMHGQLGWGRGLTTGLYEDTLRDRESPVLSNTVFNHTLSHSTFEGKKRQIDVLLFYLMFFNVISGDNPLRNGLNWHTASKPQRYI